MKSTGPDDLRQIGDPLAEEMIPGWRVEWQWVDPSEIGGALAMVTPDELRETALIRVAPHPEGEDIGETIAHELTHAALRPLVALIPEETPASIGIEERIAERLGVLIARLSGVAPARARAVIRALRADLPTIVSARARAKISALAHRRARGGEMDPKIITAALDALIAGDAEKCAELLKGLIASAAGADPSAPESNPDPGADPMAKDQPPKPGEGAPPPAGDAAARARLADLNSELVRARTARAEHEAILIDSRKGAVDSLITNLRARLPSGHKGLAATEKDILAAPNYQEAKRIYEMAIRFAPEEDATTPRARGGDRLTADPRLGEKKAIVKPADFDTFDPGFQAWWSSVAEHEGQEAADNMLPHARARLARDKQQGRTS